MEVTGDMKQAGQEFLAEEHADQARVDAKVEAMNEAAAPPVDASPSPSSEPPASSPPAAAAPPAVDDAAMKAQLAAAAVIAQKILPHAGAIAWGFIDTLVQKFAGKQYALTPDELHTLTVGTTPLINKYIPQDILKWLETPEGLAIGTVVYVYGLKYAAVQGVPFVAALSPQTAAPSTPAPSSPPAEAAPA